MSARKAHRPLLSGLLSPRTISGRLIIGLIVLIGLAGAAVSVVTANALSDSLMSSLNQQLQSATSRWMDCVHAAQGDNDSDSYTGTSPAPNCYGQATGTFEAVLTGDTFSSVVLVGGTCRLSAADEKTLLSLPTTQAQQTGQGGPPGHPGTGKPGNPRVAPQGSLLTSTRTLTSTSLDGQYMLTKVQVASGTILITGLPLSTVQTVLNSVENKEHIVFAAVLLVVLVMGTVWVRISLRPLRRIAATATQVTELPLDSGEVTLPAGVPDSDPRTEVGQVGAAFNRMLGHVERALGRRAASEARLRRFAADASHELRTPLAAIRGYAELAMRHPGPVPEQVAHALGRVQSESARMGVLVDDLLLLARLDAGRPLERAPVDLSRLAIDVTSDARVARGDHRWRLDLPDDPVLVSGDEHRLHQALANLLSNAGKHTPPGSTISVALVALDAATPPQAAAAVQRGTLPPPPRVELSITDDGPGIPPDLLPDLFERFTRGDTSRSREASAAGKSTGLGLAIVDAVVAAHSGCITVTSRPGMTRFAIVLPLLSEPAEQTQASPV
ncbi:MAG: HAMP domain-containing sensor histidine kinase [Streptosporangiaceae bacterium]